MGAGFAEGFGAAVDFGVLDEDADSGVAGSEGGEVFEGGEGLFGEFVDGGGGIDFEGVDEIVYSKVCVGVVEDGFDEFFVVGVVEGEAGGHVVSAEGFEVVGCGFECIVDGVAVD